MNPMQLGAMVAVLVAVALWCLRRALSRAPRSLAAARRRMLGGSPGDAGAPDWSRTLATGAPGRWVRRRFGAGLVTARLTPAAVVTRVVSAMAIIGLVVLCAVAALSAAGMLPVSPLWLLLPLVAALFAGLTIVQDIAGKVARAERELRRATNDFVQLVAVGVNSPTMATGEWKGEGVKGPEAFPADPFLALLDDHGAPWQMQEL